MLGTLKILMWKHLVVRRRRYILTPIELLSPIALFVILFIYKDDITPISQYRDSGPEIFNTDTIGIAYANPPQIVFYTPDTPTTRTLIERVGRKLELPRLDSLTSDRVKGYIAIKNSTGWIDQSVGRDNAFVIFRNMEESMPQKLNYTIRVMLSHATVDELDDDEISGQHRAYGTDYDSFIRLQWAIDSSYMEHMTGDSIKQQVSLQEFPYASKVRNPIVNTLCLFLEFICFLSLVLVFVFLTSRLMEDRITGIQEMIKMVGVSGTMLNLCHILNVAPAGIIYSVVATVLLKVSDNPILPNTDPLLIWFTLVLHFMTIVALAFVVSGLIKSTQYAVTFASTMYVVAWLPASFMRETTGASAFVTGRGLAPHLPMIWFFINAGKYEEFGQGVTFSNLTKSPMPNSFSTLVCFAFSIAQILVLMAIAWYLFQINPGPFAQAQRWNFIFLDEYWNPKKVAPVAEAEELTEENDIDPRYFEQPRSDAEVGIKIANVSKVFPKHKALSNVSLDVHKGEITVLLGHNGAGKTTLMSIITGMLSATEGKVYVEGLDSVSQKQQIRKHLGLCPQHNLFFSDLSVLEHVMFFTLLKGGTFAAAKQSSTELLAQLGLEEKANNKSSELSGGMKRRLQLGCALAGDATVLVLDEPTSGLDVETRRQLWDLLLSLRGSRAVLLSTHFMEEADALGDRVAALRAGRLRCLASPMYLKRALGTGYRLTCTTVGRPKEAAISAVVSSHVSDATVKEETLNMISYNLPSNKSKNFPSLFNELESKRSELGIDNIGVGVSTLEEVFLKMCSDVQTTVAEEDTDGAAPERVYPKMTGARLCLHQFLVLFKRQFKFVWTRKITFLILQVILPILCLVSVTLMVNEPMEDKPPTNKTMAMNLDLFSKQPDRKVLYTLNVSDGSMAGVEKWYPGVEATITPSVPDTILRIGLRDTLDYNKYLAGIEINDTDAKMLYTTVVRHAAPVAMNMLSNIIAASLKMRDADGHIITTYSEPLVNKRMSMTSKSPKLPKPIPMMLIWACFTVFIITATTINAVSLPCKERIAGTRHLHILAGALPELPWLAAMAAHTLTYIVVLVIPILVSAAVLEKDSTLNQADFLVSISLVFVLGITAFLSFIYLISFTLGERGAGVVLIVVLIVFGFLSPFYKINRDSSTKVSKDSLYYIAAALGYVIPADAFVTATMKSCLIAYNNAICVLNEGMCAPTGAADILVQLADKHTYKCYFCFESSAPAPHMIVLLLQTIFIMLLVIQTERGTFRSVHDRLCNARYKPVDDARADETVRAEREYVSRTMALPNNQIPDALLVNNLHKNYPRLFRKSCNAVKGVSFSVKKGEIFGLLGVNGAGKSTIFKMLTGLEHPTRGSVFANGHHLNRAYIQYLRSLSYCPQFFGLDVFLTGYENLSLLLTLQGLSPADVATQTTSWIETVGLEKYSKRAVSSYSGGCARRLAAAAALCGAGRVALLDEPSAGVDVAARRRLWMAVRRAAAERAVVISSHSMDETEALCARIAIVCDGRVRALGSASALRAAHTAGHAVQIRITAPSGDVTDGAKSEVTRLKNRLQETFNCTLKDEHKSMLHYHVNDTMRYSQLFADLEKLKLDFPDLIQDYSVTETTLEEVFLSFATEKRSDGGPTPV